VLAVGATALGALLLAAGITLLVSGGGSATGGAASPVASVGLVGSTTLVSMPASMLSSSSSVPDEPSPPGSTAADMPGSSSSDATTTAAPDLTASNGIDGIVRLVATTATGTRALYGVVVEEGMIVTTMSGVHGATALSVDLPGSGAAEAKVVGVDGEAGAAVLSTSARSTGTARTGRAGALVAGSAVRLMSMPGKAKVVKIGSHATVDGENLKHLVQLDLPKGAQPAEGEPLLDSSGAVVALCTHDADGDTAGVPIEIARGAARSVERAGKILIPWLGVSGNDVGDGDDTSAALVQSVTDPSPAHDAGVLPKDQITAVGDVPVHSMSALVLALREHDAGDVITLAVTRGGQPVTLKVTLGSRPPDS
jgi:S1-C subfamily serine protease